MKRSIFSIIKVAILFAAVISLISIGCEKVVYDPIPGVPSSEEPPILLGEWVQLPQTGDAILDTYLTFLPGGEGKIIDPIMKCSNGGGTERRFMWISYMDTTVAKVEMNIYREIICGDTVTTYATEVHTYKIDKDTLFLMYHNWVRK